MEIQRTVLAGAKVRLEPLAATHLSGLAAAIADGALWEIPVTTVPRPEDLPKYFNAAEAAFASGKELPFATIDAKSGAVVGSTRFRCIEIAHRRVEIGATFIARSWQRTHINTEAKYLMLCHAFEHWGCNRVEFMTDVLNIRSREAIARLGARQEGILRSHMVMRDGRIRDSVLFSITSREWPQVRQVLEQKLNAHWP
jgi:RimJ/RimL family protein N-acetyltransferase